ncbi:MAG: aminotransferase class III-fold pyridoxal phosphate-dependent enzyme, partial [Alphaproteobacteria bacterium]|nr:aminotransferase class III-fold pyridoxal phosphate-dependent enzyme [Alphaproteobacteria bacterium]
FPLGALLATEAAASCMTAGSHGSTYGGNPLACAVGSAVMDIVADQGFLDAVSRKAGALRQSLEGLVAAHPDVFEAVRGSGLMLGLKCRVPTAELIAAAYHEKLLAVPAADNVIRILPPLNIGDAEIAEATQRLDRAAAKARQHAA